MPDHPEMRSYAENAHETVVEVRDLVVKYEKREILHRVSLDVYGQECLAIMGQSGCGKTTLLRTIIGLVKPTSGIVKVHGRDVGGMSRREYREFCQTFGMLFQGGALFQSMNILDNVAFPVREHTRLADSVIKIMARMKLELVGLEDAEKLLPSELSGGMRRRAGLARALVMDPKLVFLDEPTSGLDPVIAAGIDELILKIKRAFQTTVVIVTHDIESGFRVADRMCIVQGGNIVAIGAPEEIKKSEHPYVKRFLNRQPEEFEKDDQYIARLTRG
ncbi:MAG TPA: ABC transporter ATP-binding protein [Candidatus Brocadiia bacterium]|nr:ABC transporter ATP-binding protein [Candidatus Brocadiia bacterium]